MIAPNPHSNCTSARLYYYDFLSDRARQDIPEGTLRHIGQCDDCQAEIERLGTLLTHAEENTDSEQHRRDSAISTLLELHFAYVGNPVTCNIVKPFLASLADPILRVRIPTPITMHVDKCRACSNDLRTLRDLHLTHKQLCHLGQLLAQEPVEEEQTCAKARAAIPAVVSIVMRETNAETRKHLCTCPDCRRHLYRRRESLRQKLPRDEAARDNFACESVSASDIYDYALPYGIDPAGEPYAESRERLAAHLGTCPDCLAKVQELHRTISNIAERADSHVVTVYHFDESAKENQRAIVNLSARLKRGISGLRTRSLLKPGLAAAAVILVGLSLLLYSPRATAVTISQMYSAVGAARNIYITTSTNRTQEEWVSAGLNCYLLRTGTQWVLSDLGAGIRKSRDSSTGVTNETPLTQSETAAARNQMNTTLAFLPFGDFSHVPPNAEWRPVANSTLQASIAGSEVYELTWSESTSSSVVHRKWRFYVDPLTTLPHKIELYQKRSTDSDYSFKSSIQVEYPSDVEMEVVINGAFPPDNR